MPLYEYHCGQCGADFEFLVRNGERPACPSCGGGRLEKQFSVPAAPITGGTKLSISDPPMGGCGRPECGQGRCAGGGL